MESSELLIRFRAPWSCWVFDPRLIFFLIDLDMMAERRISLHTLPTLFLTLFATLPPLVSTAAMISNTPSPRNLNLNTTTTNANYCTDSPTWVGAGSTRMDCIAAVQHLYDVEVKRYNWQDFEFLSERAKKREEDSMQTPRKYSVGERIHLFV